MINNKIYLKNLGHFDTPFKLMDVHKKLLEIFCKYGKVKRIEISIDKNFGIVEMSEPSEVKKVKVNLKSMEFDGRKIMIESNLK